MTVSVLVKGLAQIFGQVVCGQILHNMICSSKLEHFLSVSWKGANPELSYLADQYANGPMKQRCPSNSDSPELLF